LRGIGARGTVDGPRELEVLRLKGGIESVPGVPWHEVESPAVGAPRLSEARVLKPGHSEERDTRPASTGLVRV
jgi:hypothetical protein